MNLLEVFFVISGVTIFILALDIARRQKFNALHFFIFLFIGGGLLIFTLFPSILNAVGKLFGLQRGADLLVYSTILFLVYFSLVLLRKVETSKTDITTLIREIALQNAVKNPFDSQIVFLIRAFNEAPVVGNTISELTQKGYLNILLVDDGSTDNTGAIVQEFPQVTYLKHYKNRGAGAALETGFEYLRRYSTPKYVFTFDADGQHDVDDIEKFIEILENHKNIQLIFGSRFLKKNNTKIPLTRKIILKLGIVFTFFMSQIRLTDAHNGFRGFRPSILKKVYLSIDGMGYASEFIDIVSRERIPFMETSTHIIYTPYSLKKGQKGMNAINIVLHMIWNKFFK